MPKNFEKKKKKRIDAAIFCALFQRELLCYLVFVTTKKETKFTRSNISAES